MLGAGAAAASSMAAGAPGAVMSMLLHRDLVVCSGRDGAAVYARPRDAVKAGRGRPRTAPYGRGAGAAVNPACERWRAAVRLPGGGAPSGRPVRPCQFRAGRRSDRSDRAGGRGAERRTVPRRRFESQESRLRVIGRAPGAPRHEGPSLPLVEGSGSPAGLRFPQATGTASTALGRRRAGIQQRFVHSRAASYASAASSAASSGARPSVASSGPSMASSGSVIR